MFGQFLAMVFKKTSVIMQPFSPPFFVKKRVTFQKNTFFQLFMSASSFFSIFLFFHVFPCVFENTMFHASVGPLGLSLRPNLATARAGEGQSIRCFLCFLDRDTFSHFSNRFVNICSHFVCFQVAFCRYWIIF